MGPNYNAVKAYNALQPHIKIVNALAVDSSVLNRLYNEIIYYNLLYFWGVFIYDNKLLLLLIEGLKISNYTYRTISYSMYRPDLISPF